MLSDVSWASRENVDWDIDNPARGWTHAHGLIYRFVSERIATESSPGRAYGMIRARYSAWLSTGEKLDSSNDTPTQLDLSQVFEGWKRMIPLMVPGEIVQVVIPHTLACGPEGRGPVPGGATLHFLIELVDAEAR